MATSTVAHTMGKLLSVVLLLGAAVTSAQSVQPTNGTLPAPRDNIQEQLRLAGPHNSTGQAFNIAPLTGQAGAGGTAVDLSVRDYSDSPAHLILASRSITDQGYTDMEH
jgi:hypothetical protein